MNRSEKQEVGFEFSTDHSTIAITDRLNVHKAKLVGYRARNFKAFLDTGWLQIAPLVLFYGNNSAGKTAIHQPLVFLHRAYINETKNIDFANIWNLDTGNAVYSDLKNARSTEDIMFDFRFKNENSNECTYSLVMHEDGRIEVSLEAGGTITELNDFYTPSNVFFLSKKKETNAEMDELVRPIMEALRDFAKGFLYMRPQRISPKRDFNIPQGKVGGIESDGQNAYEALINMTRGNHIENRMINDWIEKFGYELVWEETGINKGKILLRDIDSNLSANLVDNGYGVGQSLPLIIKMAIMQDEILLVDSPEAFLQTKMHGEMADAILECAKRGNNLIIETGSEYILYRMRRRVVEHNIERSELKIYFISDSEFGNSVCEEITINDNGRLSRNSIGFNEFFSSDFDDMMQISMSGKKNG